MHASDTHHLQEMLGVYYPTQPTRQPPATAVKPTPSFTSLPLVPRTCCGMAFTDLRAAISHWFTAHFYLVDKQLTQSQAPPCTHFKDLGNRSIPIIQRVAFFLGSIKHPPATPRCFRPAPHARPPLEFKNPISATLAMAYDFVAVVLGPSPQYLCFVMHVHGQPPADNLPLQGHIRFWPYWAAFLYPSLMHFNPETIRRPPPGPLNEIYKRVGKLCPPEASQTNLFCCSQKGCDKSYRQQAGLLYHMQHTHKLWDGLRLECPFHLCQKVYSSTTGMRNHLKNCHLQPHHFDEDSHPEPTTEIVQCPIPPCSASLCTQRKIRQHLVLNHFLSMATSLKSPCPVE